MHKLSFYHSKCAEIINDLKENFSNVINQEILRKIYDSVLDHIENKYKGGLDIDIDSRITDLLKVKRNIVIFDGEKDLEKCLGGILPVFNNSFKYKCNLSDIFYLSFILDFLKNEQISECIYEAINDYFTLYTGVVFDIKLFLEKVYRKNKKEDFIYYAELSPVSLYLLIKKRYEEEFRFNKDLPLSLLEITIYAVKTIAIYDAINILQEIKNYDEYFIEYSDWLMLSFYINEVNDVTSLVEIINKKSKKEYSELVQNVIDNTSYLIYEDIYRLIEDEEFFSDIIEITMKDKVKSEMLNWNYIYAFYKTIKYIKNKKMIDSSIFINIKDVDTYVA